MPISRFSTQTLAPVLGAIAFALAVEVVAVGGLEEASADRDWQPALAALQRNDWPRAITLLSGVVSRDAGNAEVHNRLGFAYRKSGNLERAFVHYRRALEIAPAHLGAHEYIGEAYVMAGDLASARRHLAELERLCGKDCEETRDLAKAIAGVPANW